MATHRQTHARILRNFRKVHRYTGAFLFLCFLFIAVSGLALGLKKHSGGYILPETQKGTSTELSQWLPLHTLEALVTTHMEKNGITAGVLDRIDVRKEKGIAKFIFTEGQLEVQVDGSSGAILSTGRRHSDWLEDVHDGSIVDDTLGIPHGIFKVMYTVISGLALLIFTVTGFWLWYGPKYMKRLR
ncbi:PepSY domain-containing protein [Robertkochia sediminum]|uniref:PepSY domain-containing protein n=1 Tax=Robertkochia sediminum TaxID=2785326 RepID=UPI0019332AAD|nr:PepSY domain-containing protein [Robertkochia sediminum]MBL7472487.1 PepSY domain-containing protein [Robertkochia sediminum]